MIIRIIVSDKNSLSNDIVKDFDDRDINSLDHIKSAVGGMVEAIQDEAQERENDKKEITLDDEEENKKLESAMAHADLENPEESKYPDDNYSGGYTKD